MIREYMLNFGYTNREIDKILSSTIIIGLKTEFLYKKIVEISTFLMSLGYSKKQIIKMMKSHPRLLCLTVDNLNKKISDLIENDYNISLIIKMTSKCPQIYSLSIDNIENKTNQIMELGYRREEVLEMVRIYPTIYTFTISNMKKKLNELTSLGYSYEKIIIMTKKFPQLYSLNIDNIREKVDFFEYIGLADLIVLKNKLLMQSVELSYARYMFFLSMGISITKDNCEKLFMTEAAFEKRYKKSREELLELYKYDYSKISYKKRIKG